METKELVSKSIEQINKYSKLVRQLEENEKVLNDLKGLEVAMTDRSSTKYLTDVLTTEDMEKVKNIIISMVKVNGDEARTRLESMLALNSNADSKEVKAMAEDTEKEKEKPKQKEKPVIKEEQEQKKSAGRPKSTEIDYATIKEMYISKNMTVKDIGFKLGISKSTLYAYIVEKGLRDLKNSQQTPNGLRG